MPHYGVALHSYLHRPHKLRIFAYIKPLLRDESALVSHANDREPQWHPHHKNQSFPNHQYASVSQTHREYRPYLNFVASFHLLFVKHQLCISCFIYWLSYTQPFTKFFYPYRHLHLANYKTELFLCFKEGIDEQVIFNRIGVYALISVA